jgi:hypothetical protein
MASAVVTAPQAPMLTFVERYHDSRYDTEADSYARLLGHFDPMSYKRTIRIPGLSQSTFKIPTTRRTLDKW